MKVAIYPGTFDPITNGHLDIARRAAQIFDRLIVAASQHPGKNPLFSLQERLAMVRETVKGIGNVEVEPLHGLLVQYAKQRGATALIRGLRAVSDFEYEFQMALMNRKLMPEMETVFLMPSEEYTYLNSTIVKEVASLGGKVDCFLPAGVAEALYAKLKTIKNNP